eukprot:3361224-Alexandrium_andersonii.AAC.1
MSASLVGSEMCIRDRAQEQPQHLPLKLRSGALRAIYRADSESAHESEPVSYTHLTLPTICSV